MDFIALYLFYVSSDVRLASLGRTLLSNSTSFVRHGLWLASTRNNTTLIYTQCFPDNSSLSVKPLQSCGYIGFTCENF